MKISVENGFKNSWSVTCTKPFRFSVSFANSESDKSNLSSFDLTGGDDKLLPFLKHPDIDICFPDPRVFCITLNEPPVSMACFIETAATSV